MSDVKQGLRHQAAWHRRCSNLTDKGWGSAGTAGICCWLKYPLPMEQPCTAHFVHEGGARPADQRPTLDCTLWDSSPSQWTLSLSAACLGSWAVQVSELLEDARPSRSSSLKASSALKRILTCTCSQNMSQCSAGLPCALLSRCEQCSSCSAWSVVAQLPHASQTCMGSE